MYSTMLKAKLHRASVTHAELDYEGSCAIDSNLLDMAGIHEYEQIHIYNINNGERFVTYAIRAEAGSGIVSVNGAAAHKANPQDLVIICTYASIPQADVARYKPQMIYFSEGNKVSRTSHTIPVQLAL